MRVLSYGADVGAPVWDGGIPPSWFVSKTASDKNHGKLFSSFKIAFKVMDIFFGKSEIIISTGSVNNDFSGVTVIFAFMFNTYFSIAFIT